MNQENKTITIFLFGRTGAGKSSLGNKLLGKDYFQVSHTLISQTDSVAAEVCTWPLDPSWTVKIVDTPGFAGNRREFTNEALIARTLDFLKNTKDGLNIALYCLPARARIDQHDTDELQMMSLLLGNRFFDHVCLAITQANTLTPENRHKICQKFVNDLPGIFMRNGLPQFTKDRILFADFDNLKENFLGPLTSFINAASSYAPDVSREIDIEDPESIKRFLAKPEMEEVKNSFEKKVATQRMEIEINQQKIAQHQQGIQKLTQTYNQEQGVLQNDLRNVNLELTSLKNRHQRHMQKLEDLRRQREREQESARNSMNPLITKKNQMQRELDKLDNKICSLNATLRNN